MNQQSNPPTSCALSRLTHSTLSTLFLPALLWLLAMQSSLAGSATWLVNPATDNWNDPGNWTPQTIPNSPSDMATFDVSSQTSVSLFSSTEVNGITFNPGASAYTIAVPGAYLGLTLSGVGIINNSGVTQYFVAQSDGTLGGYSLITFKNNATAGDSVMFAVEGPVQGTNYSGSMFFFNDSTAGNASIVVGGSPLFGYEGGSVYFVDSATAGGASLTLYGGTVSGAYGGFLDYAPITATTVNANFTVNGGTVTGAYGADAEFYPGAAITGNSNLTINGASVGGAYGGHMAWHSFDAGDATYTVNGGDGEGAGGGLLYFYSTPGVNGTLIANRGSNGGAGGTIYMNADSGAMPIVKVFGNGTFDMSGWYSSMDAVGSIEGSGRIFLGPHNLLVGANNVSTIFSGVLQDNGAYGQGPGSLTKVGSGTLALSGTNIYTGGTTVSGGTLLVDNTRGSATGTGSVTVNIGTLRGDGIITGAVTLGGSNGSRAFLSPGNSHLGALRIKNALIFESKATYACELNSNTAVADRVVANGIVINSGALFALRDLGSGILAPGTVFMVINNTAATPITGTFSNLADGSIFTLSSNNYQVSYEGGDGNDLTLTVQ